MDKLPYQSCHYGTLKVLIPQIQLQKQPVNTTLPALLAAAKPIGPAEAEG